MTTLKDILKCIESMVEMRQEKLGTKMTYGQVCCYISHIAGMLIKDNAKNDIKID